MFHCSRQLGPWTGPCGVALQDPRGAGVEPGPGIESSGPSVWLGSAARRCLAAAGPGPVAAHAAAAVLVAACRSCFLCRLPIVKQIPPPPLSSPAGLPRAPLHPRVVISDTRQIVVGLSAAQTNPCWSMQCTHHRVCLHEGRRCITCSDADASPDTATPGRFRRFRLFSRGWPAHASGMSTGCALLLCCTAAGQAPLEPLFTIYGPLQND